MKFKNNLNALVERPQPTDRTVLKPASERDSIPAVRGSSGNVASPPTEAAGGEIGDEVFQEQSRQTVNYTVTAEDDPTTFFIVEAVTQLVMVEEGGRLVTLNFEPPDNAE